MQGTHNLRIPASIDLINRKSGESLLAVIKLNRLNKKRLIQKLFCGKSFKYPKLFSDILKFYNECQTPFPVPDVQLEYGS